MSIPCLKHVLADHLSSNIDSMHADALVHTAPNKQKHSARKHLQPAHQACSTLLYGKVHRRTVPCQFPWVFQVALRHCKLLLAGLQHGASLCKAVHLTAQILQLRQALLRSLFRIHLKAGPHSKGHLLQPVAKADAKAQSTLSHQ